MARHCRGAAAAALLFLAAPLMAQSLASIGVTGPRTPGGLLQVMAPAELDRLWVDGAVIDAVAPGRFLVGVARDSGSAISLRADGGTAGTEYVVAVTPRQFRIQRLPALGTTDNPSEEWLDRRRRELAVLNAAKVQALANAGRTQGWMQGFARPAQGRISGVFGSQRYYGGLPRNPHWGLDIAAPTGTPVTAPADGVVRAAAGPYLLEGNIVLLDHGGGLVSSFLHLSSMAVRAGDVLKQGDLIGAVGSTGRSTGPHLHWGVGLLNRAPSGFRETRLDPALLVPEG